MLGRLIGAAMVKWLPYLFSLLVLMSSVLAAAPVPIPLGHVKHLFDLEMADDLQMALPTDVTIGQDGRVYVVDGGNHRVLAYNKEGEHLFTIGKRGRSKGDFRWPLGIASDSKGQIYVADKGNKRIQIFDPAGNFVSSFLVRFRKGGIGTPIDLAISEKTGLIFVTERERHHIMVFESDGTPLGGWGKEGVNVDEFRYPATVATYNGFLYVVDSLNTVVKIFDERGRFEFQIGEWGVLPGQFYRPKGIAVDDRGWAYVSDGYMDVVEVFDDQHKFRYVIATNGKKHKFHSPTGMAVDRQNRLYVAEQLGNKVSVFELQ
jgi:DNA-binding beta-propeller fold protein YncE